MRSNGKLWAGLVLTASLAMGCSNAAGPAGQTTGENAPGAPDATYILAEKPAESQGVIEARESSESDEEVTVVGRIGGSAEPFVNGLAAFTIVDPSLSPCPDEEGCPTPWDYCCEPDLAGTSMAMVKIVDAQGKPVSKDARELIGVKELSTVVVRGKAKRDDEGNLTVLAEKVHVVKD